MHAGRYDYSLTNLQVHEELLAVIERAFSQAVVAPQPVDVACEGAEVGASEHPGAAADDGLHHAVRVGVHAGQHAAPQKVPQEADAPARLDECLPARL